MKKLFSKRQDFFVLGILLANSAYAGPPFVTDDPEPVDYEHWEINTGISKTWNDTGYSAAVPGIDINYGFTENLQLHIQPKYSFVDNSGSRFQGVDNTEVGIKYRFANDESEDSTFMVGVYPMVQVASGSRELSAASGKTQIFLPVWAQYAKEDWVFYGGTGYRLNNWLGSKNSLFVGGVVLYRFTEKFSLGGEAFNETATAIGEKRSSGFNLGGIYELGEHYHFLFAAGRALNNIEATNQLSIYLALQLTY